MSDSRPLLPLMLAGVTRSVRDVLRLAGVPSEPIQAGQQAGGRFVVFDSRVPQSVRLGQEFRRQGRSLIDLSDCEAGPNHHLIDPGDVLVELRKRLESLGGLWMRLVEYPHPYQSVYGFAVELVEPAAALRFAQNTDLSCFISSRLRRDELLRLHRGGMREAGWWIDNQAVEKTRLRTESHWLTRAERFRETGIRLAGMRLLMPDLEIPRTTTLRKLGLHWSCSTSSLVPGVSAISGTSWPHLATVTLPGFSADGSTITQAGTLNSSAAWRFDRPQTLRGPQGVPASWDPITTPQALIRHHHRMGLPLFVHECDLRPDWAGMYEICRNEAARSPLMWSVSFDRFARWWRTRNQIQIEAYPLRQGVEIRWTAPSREFVAAVEVWRGGHRAVLPLTQNPLAFTEPEIAFVQQFDRRPTGLVGTVPLLQNHSGGSSLWYSVLGGPCAV